MRVWLLDTGTLVIDQSHITWNQGAGTPVRFPTYGVLVEHEDGLLLFDTGYDLEHVNEVLPFELPEQEVSQTIPAQVELCGFAASDVAMVVNSHLHFDHVGGNKHLPAAEVLVDAREIAQGRNCEPFEALGYSDRTWDHGAARLVPISGDVEVAPGVRLFETPGHTIGHYSMLLTGAPDSRPMLFIADVTYTQDSYDRGVQAGFHHDPVAGVRSIQRVKDLAAEHRADIFLTHDLEAWGTYRHAPEHYTI